MRAQVDVVNDLAVRRERDPAAAPARLPDRNLHPDPERRFLVGRETGVGTRDRHELGGLADAIVRQMVVQIREEAVQVVPDGLADRDRLLHSARAIRIFWMSLVPS
ncbi:hypothetical protein LP420_21170 [Massilia sp. B-10]|nr:hypothetical protein LP420_21170 [Massilia sp. B-10]